MHSTQSVTTNTTTQAGTTMGTMTITANRKELNRMQARQQDNLIPCTVQ